MDTYGSHWVDSIAATVACKCCATDFIRNERAGRWDMGVMGVGEGGEGGVRKRGLGWWG